MAAEAETEGAAGDALTRAVHALWAAVRCPLCPAEKQQEEGEGRGLVQFACCSEALCEACAHAALRKRSVCPLCAAPAALRDLRGAFLFGGVRDVLEHRTLGFLEVRQTPEEGGEQAQPNEQQLQQQQQQEEKEKEQEKEEHEEEDEEDKELQERMRRDSRRRRNARDKCGQNSPLFGVIEDLSPSQEEGLARVDDDEEEDEVHAVAEQEQKDKAVVDGSAVPSSTEAVCSLMLWPSTQPRRQQPHRRWNGLDQPPRPFETLGVPSVQNDGDESNEQKQETKEEDEEDGEEEAHTMASTALPPTLPPTLPVAMAEPLSQHDAPPPLDLDSVPSSSLSLSMRNTPDTQQIMQLAETTRSLMRQNRTSQQQQEQRPPDAENVQSNIMHGTAAPTARKGHRKRKSPDSSSSSSSGGGGGNNSTSTRDNTNTSESPDRSMSMHTVPVCICATQCSPQQRKHLRACARRGIISSVQFGVPDRCTTHLVVGSLHTQRDGMTRTPTCYRDRAVLHAICHGIHLVSFAWIEASERHHHSLGRNTADVTTSGSGGRNRGRNGNSVALAHPHSDVEGALERDYEIRQFHNSVLSKGAPERARLRALCFSDFVACGIRSATGMTGVAAATGHKRQAVAGTIVEIPTAQHGLFPLLGQPVVLVHTSSKSQSPVRHAHTVTQSESSIRQQSSDPAEGGTGVRLTLEDAERVVHAHGAQLLGILQVQTGGHGDVTFVPSAKPPLGLAPASSCASTAVQQQQQELVHLVCVDTSRHHMSQLRRKKILEATDSGAVRLRLDHVSRTSSEAPVSVPGARSGSGGVHTHPAHEMLCDVPVSVDWLAELAFTQRKPNKLHFAVVTM